MSERRICSLDLLRGVAAFGVAVPHFLLYRGVGDANAEKLSVLAVEVFFVLSGFVLAPQIVSVLKSRSLAMLWRFWVRRWMRTVPAYLLALIFVSIMFGQLGSAEFWRYALYIQNFANQANATDYYSVAWSLSVEEWFYLFFPLAMLVLTLRLRVWQAALCFVTAIAVVRFGFAPSDAWGAGVRRVVMFRVDSVAYGFLLWLALRDVSAKFLVALSLLIVSAIGCWFALNLTESNALAQSLYPELAAAFGSGAILCALSLEKFASRFPRFCEASGALSYAIYLFHLLAVYIVAALHLTFVPGLIVFVLATIGLSWLSAYQLERPILAARPALRPTRSDSDVGVLEPT